MKMMRSLLITIAILFGSTSILAAPDIMPGGERDIETRGWTVWDNLGGAVTSDPAACTAGNWTYVFVRNTNNSISYRVRSLATGVWADWALLDNQVTTGAPAVSCTYNSSTNWHVDVFIAGTNGNLYMKTATNGAWGTTWRNLGGVVSFGSGPAATSNVVGDRIEVFVRGTDQTLFRKYRYFGSWSGWQRVSTAVKSDPAAVLWSQSHMDIFAVAPTDQLWSRMWEGNIWYTRQIHAGVITSSPDAVSRSVGNLDVFARGPANDLLWKNQVNGVWSGWTSLGGVLTSGPGAATYASNARMMVFVRGTDGALWYRAWAP